MTARAPFQRLPYEPVERVLQCDHSEQARRLHVPRSQLLGWVKNGITYTQADRVAMAMGRHPAELWDEWGQI